MHVIAYNRYRGFGKLLVFPSAPTSTVRGHLIPGFEGAQLFIFKQGVLVVSQSSVCLLRFLLTTSSAGGVSSA